MFNKTKNITKEVDKRKKLSQEQKKAKISNSTAFYSRRNEESEKYINNSNENRFNNSNKIKINSKEVAYNKNIFGYLVSTKHNYSDKSNYSISRARIFSNETLEFRFLLKNIEKEYQNKLEKRDEDFKKFMKDFVKNMVKRDEDFRKDMVKRDENFKKINAENQKRMDKRDEDFKKLLDQRDKEFKEIIVQRDLIYSQRDDLYKQKIDKLIDLFSSSQKK